MGSDQHNIGAQTPPRAVFLDKDGTLVRDIPYNVDPDRIEIMPGVIEGLRLLRNCGYRLIVVTNQSGVAHGYFPVEALVGVRARLEEMLRAVEVEIDDFIFCPHHPDGGPGPYTMVCECRKPRPGMLFGAAETHGIDLSSSWMVGDILNDVEAGNRAGCRTILIDNGHETGWVMSPLRRPDVVVANFEEAAAAITKNESHALQYLEISPIDSFVRREESTGHRRLAARQVSPGE